MNQNPLNLGNQVFVQPGIVSNSNLNLIQLQPSLLDSAVYNLETRSRLQHHKTVLEEMKITDLSSLGQLKLAGNVVPTPGLLRPLEGRRKRDLYGEEVSFRHVWRPTPLANLNHDRLPLEQVGGMARSLNSEPLPGSLQNFYSSVIPLPVAYWAASEIILEDNTTVLFQYPNRYLVVIAETIRVGADVSFTWEEPTPEHLPVKPATPPRPSRPSRPNSTNQTNHGRHGKNGKNGGSGSNGVDAPELEFWALDLEGRPEFMLHGQKGWPGGAGGDGGSGGHGAPGFNSKWKPGVLPECQPGGSGGNGGRGGNGGEGGPAGNGGNGGKLSLYMPQERLSQYADGFFVNVAPGEGGVGGRGGKGGNGGNGGKVGSTDDGYPGLIGASTPLTSCGPKRGATDGRQGNRGAEGQDGAEGQAGEDQGAEAIRFIPIDKDDFLQALTRPAIVRIEPNIVTVGETILLTGKRFTPTDVLFLGNTQANPTYVSDTTLQLTIPSNIQGGSTRVTLRQQDNTSSNAVELVIRPHLAEVKQAAQNHTQLLPGQETVLAGRGFAPDNRVLINDEEMTEVRFISPSELHFRLERPASIERNPSGESVSVKVVLPTGLASNTMAASLQTLQIVVIGDSIQWGQGLQPEEKIHSQVKREIATRAGNIGIYKEVRAHSGAHIGVNNTTVLPPIDGEIPTSHPTIMQQVDAVLGNRSEDTGIDLVLMDGGINDVNIRTILNPARDSIQESLAELIDRYCYTHMKTLLNKVLKAFPHAQIIVTGYFEIFSNASRDEARFTALMVALGLQNALAGIATDAAINLVVERCQLFKRRSHEKLTQAIAEVNGSESPRVFFVDPDFGPEHAIFAQQALLFGIEMDLSPQDNPVIAGPRAHACEINADRTSILCKVASIGHPTVAGARQYAAAINRQLPTVLPRVFAG